MKTQLLILLTLLIPIAIFAQPCTVNDASGCVCEDGSTDCYLLPNIKISYDLLADPSQNPESPGELRISASTPNVGHGPLKIIPTNNFVCGVDTFFNSNITICPDGSDPSQLVKQRIYRKQGNTMAYEDRWAGSMTYHPSHAHTHFDDWGTFSLRIPDANEPNPLNWTMVSDGTKLSFCLMDFGSCTFYDGHCRDDNNNTLTNNDFPNYGLGGGSYSCGLTNQGISVGWTDIYGYQLDGMHITIPDGTCNGDYAVVVQVDPSNLLVEENDNDNLVVVPVTLTRQTDCGSGGGSGLSATYYNNMDFTGSTITRIDPTINFSWGGGSPNAAIGNDTYSARWEGQIEAPTSGTYIFFTNTDDGVRLWVNNQQIVNKWQNQGPTEWLGTISMTAGQKVAIKMEYFENGGGAVAQLRWQGPGIGKQIIPSTNLFPNISTPQNVDPGTISGGGQYCGNIPSAAGNFGGPAATGGCNNNTIEYLWQYRRINAGCAGSYTGWTNWQTTKDINWDYSGGDDHQFRRGAKRAGCGDYVFSNVITFDVLCSDDPQCNSGGGNGSGLSATYYNNMDFTGSTITRIDPVIDFSWGTGSPDAAIESDTYSVRWEGQIEAPTSGTYTFFTNTDDGVILWVNNQQIINKWQDQGPTEWSGTISMTAGQKVAIKMEYFENGGGAVAQLRWQGPGIGKQIIPKANLYPTGGDPSGCDDNPIVCYANVAGQGWTPDCNVNLSGSQTVTFGPNAAESFSGSWSWTGPNGFNANTREITVSNAGAYTVTLNTGACSFTKNLNVNGGGGGCNPITIFITLDNYPEETSWSITDDNGTTVVSSDGTYSGQANGSTIIESVCLPDGCFNFTINDSYGDGICCGYGNGSYTVTNANGNVLALGGDFGGSETQNLCLGEARIENEFSVINIFPNPADTYINIDLHPIIKTLNSNNVEVIIFSLNGQVVYQNEMQLSSMLQLNIETLSSDQMYLLNLRTNDGRMFRGKFVKF